MYSNAKKPCIEWHDLILAPHDLPEENEEILVTTENFDGERRVRSDVRYKELTNGNPSWWMYVIDTKSFRLEKTFLWERVIAWAYLPDPYSIQREII